MEKMERVLVVLALSSVHFACGSDFYQGLGMAGSSPPEVSVLPAEEPGAGQSHALSPLRSCAEVVDVLQEQRLAYIAERASSVSVNQDMVQHAKPMASKASESSIPNVQVQGVAEDDHVQYTADRLYRLSGGSIDVFKTWPAEELNKTFSIPLGFMGTSMLLSEHGKLVVFGNVYLSSTHLTRIATFDVQGDHPVLLNTQDIPGALRSARLVGDDVRLVTSNYLDKVVPLTNVIGEGAPVPCGDCSNAEPSERLETMTLKALLAFAEIDETACPTVFDAHVRGNPLGITRIAAFSAEEPQTKSMSMILAPADLVYATANQLFVTTSRRTGAMPTGLRTFVHAFSTEGAHVDYKGSGVVEGLPLNQFALDYFEGHLRMAVSAGGEGGTTNVVKVLKLEDNQLKIVGQSEVLAPGESIFAVRFMGQRAFIVTFQKVDPLFVLDFSDPIRPRVIGALKVPGFSTYLQMIDERTLLGIGMDGLPKISVFDISDQTDPREVAHVSLADSYSSEALYDHHAITYDDETRTLVIPTWDNSAQHLRAFSISQDQTIASLGNIEMGQDGWCYGSLRGFILSDTLFGVSDHLVRAALLSDLAHPISDILDPCDSGAATIRDL